MKALAVMVPSSTWCNIRSGHRTSNMTAHRSTGGSSVPSTDPPSIVTSPTVIATSTLLCSGPTTSTTTGAQAGSAKGPALTNFTSGSSFTVGANSGITGDKEKSESSTETDSNDSNGSSSSSPSHSSSSSSSSTSSSPWIEASRLSTGAVVGIGLGISMVAAGLVTVSVYFYARRRLFKRQKKRWEAQMEALEQQDGGDGGSGSGPGLERGMIAVNTRTADGKPVVVMMTQAPAQQRMAATNDEMPKIADRPLLAAEGSSPVSPTQLTDLGWETRLVTEYSDAAENRKLSATTAANSPQKSMWPVAAREEKTPMKPRSERTVMRFRKDTIYEMG
ncbi:unnamed protein product [Discula destructiva]